MNYDFSYFKEILSQWNLELTEQKEKQFGIFYDLLIEKNKVMNLTAITEFDEVIVKHFLDSISLCNYCDLTKALKVIDLGTGAGFPGIPLKIMFPNLKMTLADSLNQLIEIESHLVLFRQVKTSHFLMQQLPVPLLRIYRK